MLYGLRLAIAALVALATVATSAAASGRGVVDDNDRVVLHGNVHRLARPEADAGAVDPALPMERMILTLKLPAERKISLDRLLAEQQILSSPNFHRWLSPEEFAKRFAPDPADIATITSWLTSHGFTIEEIARGGTWVNFTGPAAAVESSFRLRMRCYLVGGKIHHANADDPSIPRGLSDLVAGIVSLHDFPHQTMNSGAIPTPQPIADPTSTSGSSHYLAPGDFAAIYSLNSLYAAGIDGTGQAIAIVGRTHPSSTNWSSFRSLFGLAANPPVVIVNGPNPGDLGGGEDNEADLDVEWSGAVAKNATVKFVTSKSTNSTDGVDLSAQYIVNYNLAPVMSTSFSACESDMQQSSGISGTNSVNAFYNNLWMQAAAQGITAFVSSGDAGASGCNAGGDSSGSGPAVNGLASTPYNVAVGGTQFDDGSGNYWSTSNGAGSASALGYIPEVAWNERGRAGGAGLWSTGGGKSVIYAKPSWQSAPGVPGDGMRDLPDVSLSAAGHDGYLVETQGGLYSIGGTSASSPSFAGLMALVVQKTGQRQGNANPRLYQIAAAQYGGSGVNVFHDILSGNNTVPGVPGFTVGVGYDLATGLGSVDATALVGNWAPGFTLSATQLTLTIPQRSSTTATVTTSSLTGNFNNLLTFLASGLPPGVTAVFDPPSIGAPGAGSTTMTVAADNSTAPGSYAINVNAAGNGTLVSLPMSLNILAVFDLNASVPGGGGTIFPATATVVSGGNASFSVTPATGYHLAALIDNGTDVTASFTGGSYTVSSITTNHSIVGTFSLNTISVTASVTASGGAVTPVSSTVPYGGSISFTLVPDAGYQPGSLSDNGTSVAWVESPPGTFIYTITGVTSPHTLLVTFIPVLPLAVPALPPFGVSAVLVAAGIWGTRRFRRGRLIGQGAGR